MGFFTYRSQTEECLSRVMHGHAWITYADKGVTDNVPTHRRGHHLCSCDFSFLVGTVNSFNMRILKFLGGAPPQGDSYNCW